MAEDNDQADEQTAQQAGQGRGCRRHRLGRDCRGVALRVQDQEEAEALESSFAAVPFFEPHQLIVIAVGRVSRIELGGERLVSRQPFASRVAKMRLGMGEEIGRAHVLVGADALSELVAVLGQRPIFVRFRLALDLGKPPARAISPSRPSCSANPLSTAFCAGALPVL